VGLIACGPTCHGDFASRGKQIPLLLCVLTWTWHFFNFFFFPLRKGGPWDATGTGHVDAVRSLTVGLATWTRPSTSVGSSSVLSFPLCFTSWLGLLACVVNCDSDVRGLNLFWLTSRWVKSNHDGWGRGTLASSILKIWREKNNQRISCKWIAYPSSVLQWLNMKPN